MEIPFGNIKRLYKVKEAEINEAISRVLKSGWYILGNELKSFENQLANYLGVKYVAGCNSGTDSIHLALRCCGIGEDDEVITVSNTCVPTINGIQLAGAIPVFVDIFENTYMMDVRLIERAITPKTKAIMPVNLYGSSPNYDIIREICNKYDLYLIEDNAQGIGSKYKDKLLGTIGDIGCFSFYPSKNLGAFGDGGAIATDKKDLYEKAVIIRNYGQTKRYYHDLEGFNSRLDEIQCAILSVLLECLNERNNRRRLIAKKYMDNVKNEFLILPQIDKYADSNFHLFVVRVNDRAKFQEYLALKGIQTLIHYPIPVHKQKFLNNKYSHISLRATENISNEIVSIPLFPELTDEEVDYIIKFINEY